MNDQRYLAVEFQSFGPFRLRYAIASAIHKAMIGIPILYPTRICGELP
jgi:hypothetical protein